MGCFVFKNGYSGNSNFPIRGGFGLFFGWYIVKKESICYYIPLYTFCNSNIYFAEHSFRLPQYLNTNVHIVYFYG